MKFKILFRLMAIIVIAFFCDSAFTATSIKINSGSVDIYNKVLIIKGINFDTYSPVTITIGNTLLQNCTINPTKIECPVDSTPAITEGDVSWTVSISAGNGPHLNDDIDIFVSSDQTNQGCPPSSFVECYSGDPTTRNVGECQTGIITCSNEGTWGDCEGEITPDAEICNDFSDNDCDGFADCDDNDCESDPYCIPCNLFTQDCADQSEACILDLAHETTTCKTVLDGQQGDVCSWLNSCKQGYSCVVPNSNNTDVSCAYICDAFGSTGPSCDDPEGPGVDFTCVAINKIYLDSNIPDDWGACIDCNDFTTGIFPECE